MKSSEKNTQDLMLRVGARVRRARDLKNMPRRVLSDQSGVSPRYLAQLEAGAGNISISLLARVAEALDHRIEWLVSEDDPAISDAQQMVQLYRMSSPDVQGQVRQILTRSARADRAQRVCLIGLRGAGKSTLGRMVARHFEIPFVELNEEIAKRAGMPISEVMALYGADGYRDIEAQALNEVLNEHETMILAVAGGIVSDPQVYDILLASCHAIWLRAKPSDHMDRVRAQGDLRPMRGQPQAMAQLKHLLSTREGLYRLALASLDTSGRTLDGARLALIRLIEDRGFLK